MLDDHIGGRIRVTPPLNAAERAFLDDVREGGGTLRGTPTGRGDTSVPFAYLAWRPCPSGCCLTWDGTELSRHLAGTLQFVIDHLLRPGARAEGHRRFAEFTCDHVLDGAVVVQRYDDKLPHVVRVRANTVERFELAAGCHGAAPARRTPPAWPANVVALRPRRA